MELAGDQEKRPSNVRRLQPLRVLLAGRDRRFLRVTSFLLSRRGYEVKRSTLADAPATSERERADVVLLDLDGSRVDAARIVAALQAAQLHRTRLSIESGTGFSDAVEQLVPRAQFRRRKAVEAALKAWTAARLERVMIELSDVMLETRRLTAQSALLVEPLVGRTLLTIGRAARRKE